MNRSIELKDLGKVYGRKTALEGASAVWDEGSVIALVGANGGGKSTLLKLLSGILVPDAGSISGLDKFEVASMPDRLSFSRGWTAEAWLRLVATWKKAPRSRVRTVLDDAGLATEAAKSVATFSQGMLRRLLYAQTRLTDADLVLLDEPEGGLDPQWVVRLEAEMDRLRSEGRTVIFSTHWLDLAVEKADQLMVFSQGRVVAQQTTEEWKSLDPPARRQRLVGLIGTPT